jgi:hypothetical protein
MSHAILENAIAGAKGLGLFRHPERGMVWGHEDGTVEAVAEGETWTTSERKAFDLVDELLREKPDGLRPWFFYLTFADGVWKAQFFLMSITLPMRPTDKFTDQDESRPVAICKAWLKAAEWQKEQIEA